MTISLTSEIETAIVEQAQHQGMTPERLVSESLQKLFALPAQTPDEILGFVGDVYAGLSKEELDIVEEMARTTSYEQDVRLSDYGISPAELRRGIIEGTRATTMADTMTLKQNAEEAQSQAMAQQYLDEMSRLREQMQQTRREMDQGRSETGSLLTQINALFPDDKGKL
jgi:hypothetical protein